MCRMKKLEEDKASMLEKLKSYETDLRDTIDKNKQLYDIVNTLCLEKEKYGLFLNFRMVNREELNTAYALIEDRDKILDEKIRENVF